MNWAEFKRFTDETAVYPEAGTGSVGDLTYSCLGLIGEVGELEELLYAPVCSQETAIYEIGDCMYYMARIDIALEKGGYQLLSRPRYVGRNMITTPALLLANTTKKFIRDGVTDAGVMKLRELCQVILHGLHLILKNIDPDIGMDLVYDACAAKLRGRKERGALHGSGDSR